MDNDGAWQRGLKNNNRRKTVTSLCVDRTCPDGYVGEGEHVLSLEVICPVAVNPIGKLSPPRPLSSILCTHLTVGTEHVKKHGP